MTLLDKYQVLRVLALECHPQGFHLNKGTQVQHANPDTDGSHCHHQNIKIL